MEVAFAFSTEIVAPASGLFVEAFSTVPVIFFCWADAVKDNITKEKIDRKK